MTQKIYMIYIPVSNKEEAAAIANRIVSMRLAACANIIDNITSVYWWEDKLQKEEEAVLILKTKESLLEELEGEIKKLHSYTCPCISVIPIIRANEEYVKWVNGETK